MSYITEKITHAQDFCPRCKSGQLDTLCPPEIDGECIWERLRCMNCGVEVVQRYAYDYTWAEWEESEEEA